LAGLGCLTLIVLGVVILPFLLLALFANLVTLSFQQLGLTPTGALVLFLLSLFGGLVNFPLALQRAPPGERLPGRLGLMYYRPPPVQRQILAINLGGAIVPLVFSGYLFWKGVPLAPALACVAAVALAARLSSRPIPGVGIGVPFFIPPLIAVGFALLLARQQAVPVAYIAGALGTLIGVDLLNLGTIRRMGAQVVSIGGAGAFDGIFLTAIAAAVVAQFLGSR